MGLGSPITSGPFGAAGWVGSILRRMDWLSVAAIGLLMVCGLGMAWINARSYGQELLDPSSIFLRSIIWISLSLITFTVVTAINWRWIRTFAWPLYGANLLLLIATLIFGQDSGGNSRAIAVFGIAIQSSEIAKILTLVALATVLTRESAESDTLSNTLLGGLVVAPPFILVAIQPDAGTALIIVAALFGGLLLSGAATRCEVQVAYAIGMAQPISILVETFGTSVVNEELIEDAVRSVFDLRPAAILRDLDLKRPIYRKTAAYGHFGRQDPDFTWESLSRLKEFKAAVKL